MHRLQDIVPKASVLHQGSALGELYSLIEECHLTKEEMATFKKITKADIDKALLQSYASLRGIDRLGNRGENNARAKITNLQAKAIAESNKTVIELAQEYNCSLSLIRRIKNGIAWLHVPAKTKKAPRPQVRARSKLTEVDVTYIRTTDKSITELALEFNMATSTISVARSGRAYKNVKTPPPPKRGMVKNRESLKKVRDIYIADGSYREICDKFEVPYGYVSKIKNGYIYKWYTKHFTKGERRVGC